MVDKDHISAAARAEINSTGNIAAQSSESEMDAFQTKGMEFPASKMLAFVLSLNPASNPAPRGR